MAMTWASLRGALGCALLALVLGSSSVDLGAPPASFYPRFNPFFFLCTHHGELEGAGVTEGGGEVLLTMQIVDNPTAYTPGQEYQVTISTSISFDGLLVTGLYTSTPVQSAPIPAPAAFGFGKSLFSLLTSLFARYRYRFFRMVYLKFSNIYSL
ncbi:hypothetical protein LDENG_00192860 [Lucifuga dentata]|nr:hypothetical protein LDENG_00192860 [Lucifuga dentata]